MIDPFKISLAGVSFSQYATVLAGVDDGFNLDQMLAFVGLSRPKWLRADALFNEFILTDLEAGGSLDEALYTAKANAQRGWLRRIPPLDTSLSAWLAFWRVVAESTQVNALLQEHGMRPADLTRLETLWSARLESDPALKLEAVRLLAAPPEPFPKPSPLPPELPRKPPQSPAQLPPTGAAS
ncbi:MAG: hypothetical protein IPK82_35975 [Polyangiaceae bacterium]|nr:hypothetical protein [Polyangiaceae bacterium]